MNPNAWIVGLIVVLIFMTAALILSSLEKKGMQAKFTITFTEVAAVPPIQLTTTAFSGIVGTAESGSLGPTGGNGGPYAVSVDPTTPLPDGVTLDAQGNIGGTPTTPGTFSVNVTVADSLG